VDPNIYNKVGLLNNIITFLAWSLEYYLNIGG
jgi:hypothetical protein